MIYKDHEVVKEAISNGILIPYEWDYHYEEGDSEFDYCQGSWRHLHSDGEPNVAMIELTIHSDYSGGTVQQSNYEALQHLHEDLKDKSPFVFFEGGHKSRGVAIRLNQEIVGEVIEALRKLIHYPVLDEEVFSTIEHDKVMEDWQDYGKGEINLPEPQSDEEEEEFDRLRELVENTHPVEFEQARLINYCEELGGHFYFENIATPEEWLEHLRKLAKEA